MKKILVILSCIVLAAVILTACSAKPPKDVSAQASTAAPETTAAPPPAASPEEQTAVKEPAAGENNTAGSDFVPYKSGLRPYAVMIDNEGTRSLPQGGMNMAQVIYEIIVEGGETRLMPVFWDVKPEMIGPVRSSRHYFLDYALEHDAIYVHFGWSPMAQRDISKLKINNINGVAWGGEIFYDLTKDRGNWQDSYTSMERIQNFVKKAKYRTQTDSKPVFSYSSSAVDPAGVIKAESINIRFSSSYTCGFKYDRDTGLYQRIRKGNPQMERTTGKQLTAMNVIIQFTENHRIPGDKYDRQEVKTVGSGKGYFITRGKAVKIKWSKDSRNSPTIYTDEAGNPIMLNPGQTWIEIAPLAGKVTIE